MESRIDQRLAEIEAISDGATPLDAIAIAIAVEDSLGITLSDEDMTTSRLCGGGALRATVARYLSGIDTVADR